MGTWRWCGRGRLWPWVGAKSMMKEGRSLGRCLGLLGGKAGPYRSKGDSTMNDSLMLRA